MDGMGTIFSTFRLSPDAPGGLWWLLSCDWVGVLNLFPWIRWNKREMPGWLSEKKTYIFLENFPVSKKMLMHVFFGGVCLQHQLFCCTKVDWSNLCRPRDDAQLPDDSSMFLIGLYNISIYIYRCLSLIGFPKLCTGNIENSMKTMRIGKLL